MCVYVRERQLSVYCTILSRLAFNLCRLSLACTCNFLTLIPYFHYSHVVAETLWNARTIVTVVSYYLYRLNS